jgi:hypothetical protein
MGGARLLDLTNRWRPGTDSTAERTSKAVAAGRDRTLIVAIGGRPVPDIFDDEVALAGLRDRYGSHALDQGGIVHLELDNQINLGAPTGQHSVQSLGLGQGPGETIEFRAASGLSLRQTLFNQGYDNLIRNQLAAIHDRRNPQAKL